MFYESETFESNYDENKIRNKFFKEKTEENGRNYYKQRIYCVTLLRKSKKEYYGSVDKKHVTDNKLSGQRSNLFFQTRRLIFQK